MTNLFTVLGQEQSIGESYARFLHEQGRADAGTYAQGILLYAQAKAAFDGLIEETKSCLTEGIELTEVEGLEKRIEAAVNQRAELTDYVTEKVVGDTRGTKFGLGDLLKPAELLKELINGLQVLWQEYRAVQDTRRTELRQQLDALKWKPFHELTSG